MSPCLYCLVNYLWSYVLYVYCWLKSGFYDPLSLKILHSFIIKEIRTGGEIAFTKMFSILLY